MFFSRTLSLSAVLALALSASSSFAVNGTDDGCIRNPGTKLIQRPTTTVTRPLATLPVFPGEDGGCIKTRPAIKPFPTSGVTVAGLFDRPVPVRTPTAVAAVRG